MLHSHIPPALPLPSPPLALFHFVKNSWRQYVKRQSSYVSFFYPLPIFLYNKSKHDNEVDEARKEICDCLDPNFVLSDFQNFGNEDEDLTNLLIISAYHKPIVESIVVLGTLIYLYSISILNPTSVSFKMEIHLRGENIIVPTDQNFSGIEMSF